MEQRFPAGDGVRNNWARGIVPKRKLEDSVVSRRRWMR